MNFRDFERRAREIFDSIPPEYREGVDGLEVSRETVTHPSLPEVYTLGECLTESYPSEYGGAGEVRSMVVVYWGSFRALARREAEFDWEGELWETITHEVRHHLESLASEDALEVQDYVEDQNFARREGHPFEAFFYRSGNPLASDCWEVDGDVFVERRVDARELESLAAEIEVEWPGGVARAPRPERLGDVHFVLAGETRNGGEILLVLVRRRGFGGWLRGLLAGGTLEVLQTDGGRRD